MAESSIQWTDFTFNPWMGCSKVSPGCQHCYAERMANHRSNWGATWGVHGARVRTSPATWKNPIKWNKLALEAGVNKRVFCSSLADVFEDRLDLVSIRKDLFDLIRSTTSLNWMLLTKRPENILKMLPPDWGKGWGHVWLGTSTEDQTRYDLRIETLLSVPAAIHFLSAEPLIGPVLIRHGAKEGLNWVIAGGESGPGFREMDIEWSRALRDGCAKRGVAFFFKQHSAYNPKSKGNELDGKTHLNWPVPLKPKRGRPKTSSLSRKDQVRLAQMKFREIHKPLPVSRKRLAEIDTAVGKGGRAEFLDKAIDLYLKKSAG